VEEVTKVWIHLKLFVTFNGNMINKRDDLFVIQDIISVADYNQLGSLNAASIFQSLLLPFVEL
jgi:hypothetical protein